MISIGEDKEGTRTECLFILNNFAYEIIEAIKELFVRGRMLGVMNATAIAFVPNEKKSDYICRL